METQSAIATEPAAAPPFAGGAVGEWAQTSAAVRLPDYAPVEKALGLLARAVRQFRTYPATSSMCVDAVTACREALLAIDHRSRISVRVSPHDLIIDDVSLGRGTVIEQELTRRLFKLKVATIDVDTQATPRDLSRFCIDLAESEEPDTQTTFAERLAQHGVGAIVPIMGRTPAVLDVGVPSSHTIDLVDRERQRRDLLAQPDAPTTHLYPPDRGWVRVDPSQTLDTVSLVDLVVLADDPASLAQMLVRLTDGAAGAAQGREAALEQKYSDVTLLLSALDPRLAQVMFGKLAHAVLNMDKERRNTLLQCSVLPGLLDGRADGRILRDFPDMDLAESICLLLDLETAAPDMLGAALNRLDLTEERRDALAPLIEARTHALRASMPAGDRSSGVDDHARALITVDAKSGKDFSEYAAFDLSMDEQVEATLEAVRTGIAGTDLVMRQLLCRFQLVHIEPNPGLVEVFLRSVLTLLGTLERDGRWLDVIEELDCYARLGNALRAERPDVADAVADALRQFCTPSRLLALADLHERDIEGQVIVQRATSALGASLVPGFVALVNEDAQAPRARVFARIMSGIASTVAPALVAEIDNCGPSTARTIVMVLGHAGAGQEVTLGRLAEHGNPQVASEALRALAQVGTPRAASRVAREIREQADGQATAAEEALLRFPSAIISAHMRDLLGSREFVLGHPQATLRLLDRAAQRRIEGLEIVLTSLEGLRFKFWKPSLVQVARKARRIRAR